ncbi:MAG: hypothetical protein KC729_06975 [Candidatus Eisenbacteria bacterium]|uniref:Uncharacterized protein n=1 Tax=Eiseniibacteriota bacterium TaxID=2212470 RepID=A0A956RPG3_UNCEI|nr:hypothetical protein [Candidatus Eisenbacteria bacterium]
MEPSSPLMIALTAFFAVFTALAVLTLVLYALRAVGSVSARTSTPAVASENMLTPELIAVLAAAATATLRRPIRIHAVHVHHEASVEDWSRAGRLDVMYSHRFGRRS